MTGAISARRISSRFTSKPSVTPCRLLNFSHLQQADRTADIGHDRERRTPGKISRKSSSRLPGRSADRFDRPVTLPPGRARLATRPAPTGSPPSRRQLESAKSPALPHKTAAVPPVTTTSTFSRTNSAATSANRSLRPSAQRYSIADRATLHPAEFTQPPHKSRGPFAHGGWGQLAQEPDGSYFGHLLRMGCERPTNCCASDSGHDFAPLHWSGSMLTMNANTIRSERPIEIVQLGCFRQRLKSQWGRFRA